MSFPPALVPDLELAHPVHDRIDLVCLQVYPAAAFVVVTGVPSPSPCPPATPDGCWPVAHVRVPAAAITAHQGNITEVRP